MGRTACAPRVVLAALLLALLPAAAQGCAFSGPELMRPGFGGGAGSPWGGARAATCQAEHSPRTASSPEAATIIRERWRADPDIARSQEGGCVLRTSAVRYQHGDLALEGRAVWPEDPSAGVRQRLPGVLVVHTAVGLQEDFMHWKLEAIASQGYVALGVDMFGAGRALWQKEESVAARRPLQEDRALMAERMLSAYAALRGHADCDGTRIGAVGFCFGGMAVLDLARCGQASDLRCTVTFHGILDSPKQIPGGPISGEILVCHGEADPFTPPENLAEFKSDLDRRGAAWEMLTCRGALHSFTRPEKVTAGDREAGMQYCAEADAASWAAASALLARTLRP